jgi:6-phosphogluconolactonase (cycloisomerase 2 family)
MNLRSFIGRSASSLLLALLAACGGGGGGDSPTFTIGGNVTGLASGTQVVLNNNGADATTIGANGAYTFSQAVQSNGSYAVTVATQPTGQTCAVANANGSGVVANVTNVNVTCSAITYSVGGTVSGLDAGDQVTLSNNGGSVNVTADGNFSIADSAPYNGTYNVTVATQPVGKTCTVGNGTGAGVVANVTNVSVVCAANTYVVGGTVSGLASGEQVTLMNGSETLTATADGAFSFTTPVAYNGSYGVTVNQQPTGQTCSVANGAGTGVTANVSNIAVTCSTNTFTIGGTVSGLAAGEQVTLVNNGAMSDSKTIDVDGAFTFDAPVTFNGGYAVTVATQPTGQTCTVANGAGAGVNANVSNIAVTCSTNTFTIGGTVNGLTSGQLTLINNGDNANPVAVSADGPFVFAAPVAYNGNYNVTVATQPTGQTCTVQAGAGAGVNADVASVVVNCAVNTYSVGGAVSGLAAGQQVTLLNNGDVANPVTVGANGPFNFTVAHNGNYNVTVGTQPTGQTCTVSNATGAGVTGNVSNIGVSCATNTYTIGGTISGLTGQVTLVNNGDVANALNVNSNGAFTFAAPVNYGGSYAVTVGTNPVGQVCTVDPGTASGSNVTANVTSVSITCSVATFTISGTVTGLLSGQQVTLNNNGANPTTVNADGSFSFSTPVAYNGGYAVTVGTYPTAEYCSIANGSGTGVQANVTNVTVNCRPEVAYVVNATDATVQAYTVEADGTLTALGATVATGPSAVGGGATITVDPSRRFAYVVNSGDSTISQYTIAADGSLAANGTVPTGIADTRAWSLTIDPSGTHAYVVSRDAGAGSSVVSQYAINPTTGVLSPLATANVTVSGRPHFVTINAAGTYAYIANWDDGTVSQHAIVGGEIVEIPVATAVTGALPLSVTIDPTGRFAYVTNYTDTSNGGGAASVSQYTIDPTTGALVPMSTPSVLTAQHPWPVAIDPSGRYAYVASNETNSVSQYLIDGTTGALTPMATPTVAADLGPQVIAIDPRGLYAYAVNANHDNVSQYAIGAGGALSPNPAAALANTGTGPFTIVISTLR